MTERGKRPLEPAHFPYLDYRRYTFSLGLETPAGVWLSGHAASRYSPEEGTVVARGDLLEQARTAYEKIALLLQEAGLTLKQMVRSVDYVTPEGLREYEGLAALRRQLFGPRPPATTTVVVRQLLRPTALIEVEAMASPGPDAAAPGEVDGLHRAQARRLGDLLFIAGQLPFRPGTREVAHPGDIVAQAEQIYENAGRLLAAAGLGWENVVKTVEYLTPAGLPRYRETAAVRRRYLAPRYPAATGIVMPRLEHQDALLQVEFIASYGPKEVVDPGWPHYQRLTFSPGVRTGHLLFVSGMWGADPVTGEVQHPGDVAGQAGYVYQSLIGPVLRAAGVGLEALLRTVEYVAPAALPGYAATAEVRRQLLPPPFPAATGVVCESLLRPDVLIEVDAVALLP